jgi:cytochrome P450
MGDTAEPAVAPDESLNLLRPEVIENPYPTYAAIREADPVHFIEPLNLWMLTRFADVEAAFKDPRLLVSYQGVQINRNGPGVVDEPYFRLGRGIVVLNDPPEHTKLRRVFRRAFTPRAAQALAPAVERMANELVDGFIDNGEVDIVSAYSAVIPMTIITDLLKVPRADHPQIAEWVRNFAPIMMPLPPLDPDGLQQINTVVSGLHEYFLALLNDRRGSLMGDDFVSNIIRHNAADEEPESDEQLASNLMFLYFAGQDTQTGMLTNILLALDEHRDALRYLAEDTTRIPGCMHELYRYDTSGQVLGRVAVDDIQFGDTTIPAGSAVLLCMGAANRDPAQFPNPDRLDLHRHDDGSVKPHITFGSGVHSCLGKHFAQVNMPIELKVLLERLPIDSLEIIHERAVRHPNIMQRGHDALPLRWTART